MKRKSGTMHSDDNSENRPDPGARTYLPFLLRSTLLENFSSISHAFTTRVGGISPPPFASLNLSCKTGDSEENVRENISILKGHMEISDELFMLSQVHGSDVLVVDARDTILQDDLRFDAVITDIPGIPLAILTADCLPLLIYDPSKRAIGAVHAGWKGTAGHISEKTIDKMVSCFGSDPADMIVAMGPAIGPCCYEVDERLFEAFENSGYTWNDISYRPESGRPGRWMLDIAAANLVQLARAGIAKKNISQSPYCTACRKDLLYSHRREGSESGRQAAVILLQRD